MNRPPVSVSGAAPVRPYNGTRPLAAHWLDVDAKATWLATARRDPIVCYWGGAMTSAIAKVATPLPLELRLPPYCLAIQWGVIGSGQGVVNLQATAAPCAEAFYASLTVDNPEPPAGDVWQMASESWLWTPPLHVAPAANGEYRSIDVTMTTAGLYESQVCELWIVDAGGGAPTVNLYGLAVRPIPRYPAEGDL